MMAVGTSGPGLVRPAFGHVVVEGDRPRRFVTTGVDGRGGGVDVAEEPIFEGEGGCAGGIERDVLAIGSERQRCNFHVVDRSGVDHERTLPGQDVAAGIVGTFDQADLGTFGVLDHLKRKTLHGFAAAWIIGLHGEVMSPDQRHCGLPANATEGVDLCSSRCFGELKRQGDPGPHHWPARRT